VEDECGNTDSDALTINVPPIPVNVNLGADLVISCLDEIDIIPVVAGGTGAYNYLWSQPGAGTISSDANLLFQTVSNTSLTLQISDECGNTASDVLNISVPPVPIDIDLGNDLVVTCLDVSAIFAEVTGGVGTYTIEWSDQDGIIGIGEEINYQTTETSQLTAEISDGCGNTASDVITVSVPQQPVSLDLGNDLTVICTDEVLVESVVSGGIGNYSYCFRSMRKYFFGSVECLRSAGGSYCRCRTRSRHNLRASCTSCGRSDGRSGQLFVSMERTGRGVLLR
jgi:hypothetical protein